VRIRKSGCVKIDKTCCYIQKFKIALNLYRVLKVVLYFSKGFLEIAAEVSVVDKVLWPLEMAVVCFLG